MPIKPERTAGRKLPMPLAPLMQLPNWLIWKREWQHDRWTKLPRQAKHPEHYASTGDPHTWSTYEEAAAAAQRAQLRGMWGGTGFVLLNTDVTGIDIDKCIGDEGNISAEALAIIRRCDSYTEISPSTRGVRIFGLSKSSEPYTMLQSMPGGGRLEVYRNTKRFLTITGNQISDGDALAVLDDVLAELKAEHQREKGETSKSNGGGGLKLGGAADSSTSGVFHQQVCRLAERGWSVEAIEADMRAHPKKYEETKAAKYEREGRLRREIERSMSKARPASTGRDSKQAEPIAYVDLTLPLQPREWVIHDRVPANNVTLMSGEGGAGKTILAMQMAACVLGHRRWLGLTPVQGKVTYLSCEDDEDELRRRFEDVARHYSMSREELVRLGLHTICRVSQDATLAVPDRDGWMQPTALFDELRREAMRVRPKLIVLDTAADVFAGNEISRRQVTQFLTLLRKLAADAGGAGVVLISHPSLTGVSTGSGLSGSTGWHNRVRARIYLTIVKDEDGEEESDSREVEFKKNNYGPKGKTLSLHWQEGVWVADEPPDETDMRIEHRRAEQLFRTLLKRFSEAGRNVSDRVSRSYAPALFSREPEAVKAKMSKRGLEDAMSRLFAKGIIKVVPDGPPSKLRTRIIETAIT
jgi:RecA-family ATPase